MHNENPKSFLDKLDAHLKEIDEEMRDLQSTEKKISDMKIDDYIFDKDTDQKRRAEKSGAKLEEPLVGPTKKISIRLQMDVLQAMRREAARQGIPYQTLINRICSAASVGW